MNNEQKYDLRVLSSRILSLIQELYQNNQIDAAKKNMLVKNFRQAMNSGEEIDRKRVKEDFEEVRKIVGGPYRHDVYKATESL